MSPREFLKKSENITRILPFVTLSIISIIVLSVIFIDLFLNSFPHLFDGTNIYNAPLPGGTPVNDSPPNRIRNFLEITYFVGSTTAFFIAAFALVFTYWQTQETKKSVRSAERARIAGVFVDIESRWSSSQIQSGITKVYELVSAYYENHPIPNGHPVTRDDYVKYIQNNYDQIRIYMREELRDLYIHQKDSGYSNVMYVLDFFEYLGLLVHQEYVAIFDIQHLIGSAAVALYEYIELHIDERSEQSQLYHAARGRFPPTADYAFYKYLVNRLKDGFSTRAQVTA